MNFTFCRRLTYLFCLIFFSFATVSCAGVGGEASFSPHGTPLKVSINTKGEINLSVEKSVEIPTPLGALEVGITFDPAEYFNVKNTLTIRMDGMDNIYDLKGQDFSVKFESGYYKKINLSKTGENILLELEKISIKPQVIIITATPNESVTIATPNRPSPTSSSISNSPTIEEFMTYYFDLLNKQEYQSAYSMTTDRFKGKHPYSEYTSYWDTVEKTEIILIDVQSSSGSEIYVYAEIRYFYKNGTITIGHTTYTLVQNGKSWLFHK